MKDMVAALEALTDRDPNRRDVAASVLGDLLRDNALDAHSTRLIVGRLVGLAVNEPVAMVRESALNSISEAFNHHSLPLGIVQPLAAAMPTMETELLAYALYIFGATHDPQAPPADRALPQPPRHGRARGSRARGSRDHRTHCRRSQPQLLTIAPPATPSVSPTP
ncbi:hypothetical protein [Streptomyces sp. NPDC002088]|uniref:hypothetical protein n=1 Tax=Streptomyces sp. NPDC002088 TaxID=3154665 RepID=UPI00333302FF